MAWWLWVLIILGGIYCLCGVFHTVHTVKEVKRGTVSVNGPFGWIMNFAIWPLCLLVEAAINGMLM